MSFSPSDLNLYLRSTGEPYPDTPQKMMAIAPRVHNFTRNFGRGGYVEQQPNVLKDLAGNVGKLALLGLGAGLVSGLAADGSTKTSKTWFLPQKVQLLLLKVQKNKISQLKLLQKSFRDVWLVLPLVGCLKRLNMTILW